MEFLVIGSGFVLVMVPFHFLILQVAVEAHARTLIFMLQS
jgi:hypothetical protein